MTTANMITLARIALIPIFMYCAISEGAQGNWIALAIFAFASLTDGVDGYIARKYNQITDFGKLVDPLADKLLVMSALLILLEQGVIPSWACILILAREFTVSSLRSIAASKGVVLAASWWGKVKTVSQLICVMYLLAGFDDIMLGSLSLQNLLVWIMVFFTVFSGYDYLRRNFGLIKDGLVK
ncbi:MAG: CDP-diacylglycerol--glycerol-3-phosphate 3-phosphatidyltransferase [Clostridia bacterium]|nr:CDP-diacylglycerol--glycerol-3-phosphate 3-phosphatidyltransferase [Clostridia bacterium]MBQ3090907.1 CDP-diacylglycerol--glycerol-3-phosphate 3-phosphatidyltransferase [Clostridia bacterium]